MLIRSGYGREAAGNLHSVNLITPRHADDDTSSSDDCATSSASSNYRANGAGDASANVFIGNVIESISVDIINSGDTTTINCYDFGKPLQFCGSGLLAAIHALRHDLPKIIQHGPRKFHPFYNRIGPGFRCRVPAFRASANTSRWRALLGHQHSSVQSAYELPGYLLVVLHDQNDVRRANPHLKRLANATNSSLILTAEGQDGTDYVMRYFAPRYGKDEDSATGSANTLLINFWAKRLGKPKLHAAQFSKEGGEFWGSFNGFKTSLYARAIEVPF